MNDKMKKSLDLALDAIEKMTPDEFYASVYGYTPEQEKSYTNEQFLTELTHLRTFFKNGSYTFHPVYEGEVVPELSNLFWNYIEKNARSNYEDTNALFPTYYIELPQFGIRITQVYGQGTLTTIEDFDYSTVEYFVRNASRLKREGALKEKERIEILLSDKPNLYDEVSFTTKVNDVLISGNGIILKVYTSKNNIRYLIDTYDHGEIIVFYNSQKYTHDKVEIVNKYYGE